MSAADLAFLDPQIEIFAPDGFLPQNLVAWDHQPAVDLNASLHDAVLPLTGLYVIAAETTRDRCRRWRGTAEPAPSHPSSARTG